MKKYAFFLPQFHQIPENDEWWGEGFTEWTNVVKAKPLFKGHQQPVHPLNDNYYNLLNKSTVEWQTKLMHDYHVDGMIYYHYYFCGRKLLEKPAENLLRWQDIDQPFFFCWANHDWNRSWNGTRELLLKQTYGNEKEWNDHFEYLLPFFQDNRYLKIENKPVFMLYNAAFPEKSDMFDFFENRCKENGFDGIYVIETYSGADHWKSELERFEKEVSHQTQRIFFREHLLSQCIYQESNKYLLYRAYQKIIRFVQKILFNKKIVEKPGSILFKVIQEEPQDKKYIHSIFLGWDNTPRHGERGHIITPPTKKAFFRLLCHYAEQDFIFINAWNEWCEGMVLEPTKENGYKYLDWIKEWSENMD